MASILRDRPIPLPPGPADPTGPDWVEVPGGWNALGHRWPPGRSPSPPPMTRTRIDFVDVARTYAIALVTFGHAMGQLNVWRLLSDEVNFVARLVTRPSRT